MNVLLVGVDRRGQEKGRSDAIILAGIRPGRREVLLYSIPRDTRVSIPGVGFTKINHAAAHGGITLLKTSLEQWLGIPIDHWVMVDFDGFRRLVDRMGGVPVDVDKAMDYDDPADGTHIHLVSGRQWLDGQAALDYARFRGDPEADGARVRRQLQLLRALLIRGSNPGLWPALVRDVADLNEHVTTDFGSKALVNLALALYPFDQVTVRTRVLTGVPYVDRRDGVWYLAPDRRELHALRQALARSGS
ncbi:MAG: LCP family protein [Kyrpidia sp.]|nr:LCP family protein [Kyrpidia sp.]